MDLTFKEILTYLTMCGGIVGGLFVGFKYLVERLDLGKTRKQTATEKAYDAVWKLYEDAKQTIEKQNKEIEELQKGDSLSRPTVSNIYQAVRKLGRQLEILDSVFLKEFFDEEISDEDLSKLRQSVKQEMEILWQKFDELEKALP